MKTNDIAKRIVEDEQVREHLGCYDAIEPLAIARITEILDEWLHSKEGCQAATLVGCEATEYKYGPLIKAVKELRTAKTKLGWATRGFDKAIEAVLNAVPKEEKEKKNGG